ncbi:hypothetical protein DL96DRAFT_1557525 [Flagelloscypha sp. PMI_526]|nr:hypothetical protein DL96DRAFT_1557525 [Flagelloscypha sp. PMI_526]
MTSRPGSTTTCPKPTYMKAKRRSNGPTSRRGIEKALANEWVVGTAMLAKKIFLTVPIRPTLLGTQVTGRCLLERPLLLDASGVGIPVCVAHGETGRAGAVME